MSKVVQYSLRGRALSWTFRLPRTHTTGLARSPTKLSRQQWRNASVLSHHFGIDPPQGRRSKKVTSYNNIGSTPEKDRAVKHIRPTLYDRQNVRAMATWLSWNAKDIDEAQILRQLPVRTILTHIDTAIFFVSSKLAHLLEPGSNFLNDAMNRMFPAPFHKDSQPIRSIVAVVDYIPALSYRKADYSQMKTAEGIAVCLTSMPEFLLDSQNGQADAPVISLCSFSKHSTGPGTQQRHIIQKLQSDESCSENPVNLLFKYSGATANTLFVNGRKHTMTLQQWDRVQDSLMCGPEMWHLSQLHIPSYRDSSQDILPTRMEARLEQLTEPAQIVSSMGNILRQISNEKNEIISASHELETLVPTRLKAMQESAPDCEIRVHAVVYPKKREGTITRAQGTTNMVSSYALHHLLGLEGARLFRVTSGGAGWGKKAGLLSLDPVTEINQPPAPESASSFFPGFELEGEETEKNPNTEDKLLPEGHYVQFLASFAVPQKTTIDPERPWLKRKDVEIKWRQTDYFKPSGEQAICVGTSILEPVVALRDVSNDVKSQNPKKTYFYPNKFGFISSSPLSVSVFNSVKHVVDSQREFETDVQKDAATESSKAIHSTLFEVPHGFFYAVSPAGGMRIPPENAETEMIHPEIAEIIMQMKERMPRRVDKTSLQKLSDEAISNNFDEHEKPENPAFRTRYVERFFQHVTGFNRPGDVKRLNRAIVSSDIVRRLRGYYNSPQMLKRFVKVTLGHKRRQRLKDNEKEVKGLVEFEDDKDSDGPVIRKVKGTSSVRKIDEHDNRMKAAYTDYQVRDAKAFKEEIRQRAEDMAPEREVRYASTKSVRSEDGTGVFDRQRKQEKQEKDVMHKLFDDLDTQKSK